MKTIAFSTLLAIVALSLSACSKDTASSDTGSSTGSTPAADPPQPSERVATLMGGRPHAKAITETGKATAYRIGKDDDFNEIKLSDGVALTDDQRATLFAVLANDASYEWDIAKDCEPMPGVLVTFEDGATYARLRICYSCRMLGYTPGDWEDFDPAYPELVDWAKGVFPDDQAVQQLDTFEQEHGL